MTIVEERSAVGRRKSDRAPLPEWLPAPLLESEEPRDGDLADPCTLRPRADYLCEFHSDGTASWLPVHAVAVAGDGSVAVTFGLGTGTTVCYPGDRQAWVLRVEDAVVLVNAVSDKVLHAWGEPENAMEAHLRSFATATDLLKGWSFEVPSAAEALTAWYLIQASDDAQHTDVPPTVGSVKR